MPIRAANPQDCGLPAGPPTASGDAGAPPVAAVFYSNSGGTKDRFLYALMLFYGIGNKIKKGVGLTVVFNPLVDNLPL